MQSSEVPKSEDELNAIADAHMTPDQQYASTLHERTAQAFGSEVPHIESERLPDDGLILRLSVKGLQVEVRREHSEWIQEKDLASKTHVFAYSGTVDGMTLRAADAERLFSMYSKVPSQSYMAEQVDKARRSAGATVDEAKADRYDEVLRRLLG